MRRHPDPVAALSIPSSQPSRLGPPWSEYLQEDIASDRTPPSDYTNSLPWVHARSGSLFDTVASPAQFDVVQTIESSKSYTAQELPPPHKGRRIYEFYIPIDLFSASAGLALKS